MSRRVANFVRMVIFLVWLVNVALPFVPGSNYESDLVIHGIFIATWSSTLMVQKSKEEEDGGDGEKQPSMLSIVLEAMKARGGG